MDDQTRELILRNLWPMLQATVTATIPLTAVSFVLGLVLALLVALARISRITPLSLLARGYVSVIRGTPLLVQLFIVFYALPQFGIVIDPFPSAVIAFSLNVAGYAAEVIRGAILSIPRGQWEAAETIGMAETSDRLSPRSTGDNRGWFRRALAAIATAGIVFGVLATAS